MPAEQDFGARLRARLDLLHPVLSAASASIVEHPEAAKVYPEYLIAMHGISRAAVPLLEAAVNRTTRVLGDDRSVAPRVLKYYSHHIPEEAGHADWILEDLEVTGVSREQVLARAPSVAVAALVGSQYYLIEHVDPVALLGYLAIMEANPPSLATVAALERATGYPKEAFRSMRVHARLDVQHEADLFGLLGDLPLSARQEQMIAVNALRTTELLIEALHDFVETFDRERARIGSESPRAAA